MNYVVLGATGTLGNELCTQLLKRQSTQSILCFSRDELKQKEMAARFKNPKLRFRIGDIRDPDALSRALRTPGIQTVFHVAAMKHIEICEANPEESIKTNLISTLNVAEAAISHRIPQVVFSSTDKAVDPVNVYGMCKGLSERVLLHKNSEQSGTKFSVFRWGNVLGSRGSILKLFKSSLENGRDIEITDMEMTRFWILIKDAVSFMLDNYECALANSVMIPTIKAASVYRLADSLSRVLGYPSCPKKVIGLRPGEKIHEVLMSQHFADGFSSDQFDQLSNKDLDDMVKLALSHEGL